MAVVARGMARRVAVRVDDREPTGVVESVRDHHDVAEVIVERLDAGDLVVESMAVERKTLRDYVSSVTNRSGTDLEDQVARMTARYDAAYVLLEGDVRGFDRLETHVPPEALHGSMASITARRGAAVVPCSDRRRLVDYAVRLGRKHLEEPSRRPLPAGSVPSRRETTAKRMYGCIEGIGPELAATLYEAYPTVAGLVAADREDLTDLSGVGEKRARTVLAALRDRPIAD